MSLKRFMSFTAVVSLLSALASTQGCQDERPVETIVVSLKNTETYRYPTSGGDEESARISTQARHFAVSEIRRDAETAFVAAFVYHAEPAFIGSDYAEIETLTGSDGASHPSKIKRVAFQFIIHE